MSDVLSSGDGFSAVRTVRLFFVHALSLLLVVSIGAAAVVWLVGSRNPYTPAGYVGYLTKGAVIGRSRFYGIQRGPTSAGRTWLLDVTNISITPYTYTEEFTGNQARSSKRAKKRPRNQFTMEPRMLPTLATRMSSHQG